MADQPVTESFRVLAIDDNREVLETYQVMLQPVELEQSGYAALQSLVGMDEEPAHASTRFELTLAEQGMEGVDAVAAALEASSPYAVALIDVRLPPGIDGIEAAARIRAIDPNIYIIIASAYHDYSQSEIVEEIEHPLYFIDKPATEREVNQLVYSNCLSWLRDRQLQREMEANREHSAHIQQLLKVREAQLKQQDQLFNIYRTTSHTVKNSINFLNDMIERVVCCYADGLSLKTVLNEERLKLVQGQLKNIHILTMMALKESKGETIEVSALAVRQHIEDALQLFSITKVGHDREIVTRYDGVDDNTAVTMRPIDFQTTLLNLLNNAAAAVDEYFSELVINAVSEEDFDALSTLRNQPAIELSVAVTEGVVAISIRNMGKPIPADVAERLFQRGYTTKSDGNGIGLNDIQNILAQLSGEIRFNNEAQGVRFTVTLPQTTP